MSAAIVADQLGKRYGTRRALHDCTLEVPTGSVTALVGPNGAGKTTLLHLIVGLTEPTDGSVTVLGASPRAQPTRVLPRIGFVAQDHPLERRFRVDDMLTRRPQAQPALGRRARPRLAARPGHRAHRSGRRAVGRPAGPGRAGAGDRQAPGDHGARRARRRARPAGPARVPAGADGGRGRARADRADVIAPARRPRARVRSPRRPGGGRSPAQRADRRDRRVAPRCSSDPLAIDEAVARVHQVVHARHTPRQTTLLVRANGHVYDARWQIEDVALEDIVLAYLQHPDQEVAA